MSYPKILLISDLTLSFGDSNNFTNPTLHNLFKNYPPKFILQYAPHSTAKYYPSLIEHKQVISYRDIFVPLLRNRLGLHINPWLEYINFSLLNTIKLQEPDKIKDFKPEVILICPITPSCLIFAKKVADELKIPFIIYFMDDWLANNNISWIGGNLQHLSSQILNASQGWIMISEFLQEELAMRYKIYDKPYVIAHNPVTRPIISVSKSINKVHQSFQVAYAGSIQPIHADAILLVAQSIYDLRQEGVDIELIIYTSLDFWNRYKDILGPLQVIYGSLIPYSELHETLSKSDLLLVCTAFHPDYEYPVRSSLLTKLTDYMASGKPILSCGPAYSACNKFLEKWSCGVICSHQHVDKVKSCLRWCMTEKRSTAQLSQTALNVLQDNFSESVVQSRLYSFIQTISSP